MCQHGTKQSQEWQSWQILAPRIRKMGRLFGKSGWPLPEHSPQSIIYHPNRKYEFLSCNTWFTLARPAKFLPKSRAQLVPRKSDPLHLSRLESLPAELLATILQQSSLEKNDILAVGLTSRWLWLHVLHHVGNVCRRMMAPLAGVEIACIGGLVEDFPKSFAEDDLFKLSIRPDAGIYRCEPRKITATAFRRYEEIDKPPEEEWYTTFEALNPSAAGIPVSVAKSMAVELTSRCCGIWGSDPDALWVLRNLTSKEFVRCRPGDLYKVSHKPFHRYGMSPMPLKIIRGYVDHPGTCSRISLDAVLMLRICWTRLSPWEEARGLGFYRGVWAGHCFDIVPFEEAATVPLVDGWKDSTDEVVKQARTVRDVLHEVSCCGCMRL